MPLINRLVQGIRDFFGELRIIFWLVCPHQHIWVSKRYHLFGDMHASILVCTKCSRAQVHNMRWEDESDAPH